MYYYLDGSMNAYMIQGVCATCGMMETLAYLLSAESPLVDFSSRHTCRQCSSGAGMDPSRKPYAAGKPVARGEKSTAQSTLVE